MKTILTSAFCMLLSLTMLNGAFAQNREAMGFENQTFTLTMDDGSIPNQQITDVIKFNNRNFDSQNASQSGFTPNGYIVKSGGELGDYFEFKATSESAGTKTWIGYVKGNEISGGMIWEKPGEATQKFPFKGTLSSTATQTK